MKYDDDTYGDFKDSLKIDVNDLEEELIRQPHDFFHVSEAAALAKARRDKVDHDVDVAEATTDRDVRDQMETDGEKVTEAQVKHRITRDQEFIRAKQRLLDAQLVESKWSALKDAWRMRADMLKMLVQLNISNYYADASGSAERRDVHKRRERL